MSSLDDLLDVGEQPTEQPTGRQFGHGWRWPLRMLLLAGAGAVILNLFLRTVFGQAVPAVLIFIGLLALQVLIAVLGWVRNPLLPETLRHQLASSHRAGHADDRDGLALATRRWGRELSWFGLQGGEGEQFARTLQPRLARLVEERLRLRHGITIRSDPARARQILGEQLWALATVPARRCPSARELATLVNQMEAV